MKACPFCSKKIQNAASICDYCGGDVATQEAVLQEEADDMDDNVSAALLVGLVGGAVFLYAAYHYWSYGQTYTALASLGGSAFFFLITNFAWNIGKEIIELDITEGVNTEDNNTLIQKIFLKYLPIVSSMIVFIIVIIAVVSLSKFVFDEDPLVTGATTLGRTWS